MANKNKPARKKQEEKKPGKNIQNRIPQNIKIKMPVFVSEKIEDLNPFPETYDSLIGLLVQALTNYNKSDQKIWKARNGKRVIKTIPVVNHEITKIGETPTLILRASEYKTGFSDIYVETDKKSKLGESDKLGSDQNCIILHPHIEYINNKPFYYWLIFVYADPCKDDDDVINTARLVVKNILKLKISHVKIKSSYERLKKEASLLKVDVDFTSLTTEDGVNLNIGGKKTQALFKTNKKVSYENADTDKVLNFLNEINVKEGERRTVDVFVTPNESFRYICTFDDSLKEKIKSSVERIYNYEVEIGYNEIANMYDSDYIVKKVSVAIAKILKNG